MYNYKADKVAEFHNKTLRRYIDLLVDNNYIKVVVDNTNIRMYELAPYYRLAEAFGCDVEIIQMNRDFEECCKSTIHGVPRETMVRMSDGLAQEKLPFWWKVTQILNNPSKERAAESTVEDDILEALSDFTDALKKGDVNIEGPIVIAPVNKDNEPPYLEST